MNNFPPSVRQTMIGLVAQAARVSPGAIDTDEDLLALGIDSVTALSLIGQIEESMRCCINEDDLWHIQSVEQLIDYVTERLHGESPEESASTNVDEHDFARYVNPHLANLMRQFYIDHEFTRAKGSYLYKGDQSYLDFIAQFGALPFGHNPDRVWQALSSCYKREEPAMAQPSLLGLAGALARELVKVAPPGLERVTFCNSGAESLEVAIKIATSATGRPSILSTDGAFHGKTRGALSASGRAKYQQPFHLPSSEFSRVPYGDILALEAVLASKPEAFAAFIVEPIQGEGGVVEPQPGYLQAVRELCYRYGVLYIADEVQTGLGRTGTLFASAESDPDIIALSKALGGGLVPVGACLCRAEHYTWEFGCRHSSTFAGNSLAMAAGLATIELLTENDNALLTHVREIGEYLKAQLCALQARYPGLIAGVRGRGLLLGLSLRLERSRWDSNLLGVAADQEELVSFLAAYILNVEKVRFAATLNSDSVLRIEPPLMATREECDIAIAALDRALAVLSTGDTGRFYQGLLAGQDPGASPNQTVPGRPLSHTSGNTVAFLLHPLTSDSYADYDPTLRSLNSTALTAFERSVSGNFGSFVSSQAHVRSLAGKDIDVDFIMVPYTTTQLLEMPRRDSQAAIKEAYDLAATRGAHLIGLGAYTSILSNGGEQFAQGGLAVTTGNAYTAVAGVQNAERALLALGAGWPKMKVAVVGAGGSVSSALVSLLLTRAGSLLLTGNPSTAPEVMSSHLRLIMKDVLRSWQALAGVGEPPQKGSILDVLYQRMARDTDPEDLLSYAEQYGLIVIGRRLTELAGVDVAFVSTNSPEPFLQPEHFKSGTIVCDLSRPRNVSQRILDRLDVLLIDGGVVELPGSPNIGNYGLAHGEAYACMAETILIGLEGALGLASLQRPGIQSVIDLEFFAKKHGVFAAAPRSFGRLVSSGRLRDFLHRSSNLNPPEGFGSGRELTRFV